MAIAKVEHYLKDFFQISRGSKVPPLYFFSICFEMSENQVANIEFFTYSLLKIMDKMAK
jgi:hypothetical protein